jgi:hypothetical protein
MISEMMFKSTNYSLFPAQFYRYLFYKFFILKER